MLGASPNAGQEHRIMSKGKGGGGSGSKWIEYLAARRLALRQHAAWHDAQKNGGYSCKVYDWKSGKLIDPGRPPNWNDGITRH